MPYPYQSLIATACKLNGIEQYQDTFAALIQRESNWDPNAVGDNGIAVGLCQMHPAACLVVGANWREMNIPDKAIMAGAAYLAFCLKLCDGDIKWALAAYNRGPTDIRLGKKYAEAILLAAKALP